MRSRLPKNFSKFLDPLKVLTLAGSLLSTSNAQAVGYSIDEPLSIVSVGGANTLYLASSNAIAGNVRLDTGGGFRTYDPTQSAIIAIRISDIVHTGSPPSNYVKVTADAGNSIFVPLLAGENSFARGDILGAGNVSVQFGTNSTTGTVQIDLKDLCNTHQNNVDGCTNADISEAENITLNFAMYTGAAEAAKTAEFKLGIRLVTDSIDSICPDSRFFPGDKSVLVDTSLFSFTRGTNSSAAAKHLLVVASETAVNADPFANTIQERLPWNSGEQKVNGFTNIDPATATPKYGASFAAVDTAGLFDITVAGCQEPDMFASEIQGFLKDSNCFIATASYRDRHAPGVELLRRFRDHVLTKTSPGRAFVKAYYQYGPEAAEWLLEHSTARVPVLAFLLPIQFIAWALTEPLAYLMLVGCALTFAFAMRLHVRRRLHRAFLRSLPLLIALAAEALIPGSILAGESNQPYIDSLLSTMDPPEVRTDENPDPYIQSLKRKMGEKDSSEGYTEKLRQEMDEKESSEGYAERIQKNVKPMGSAIQDFRDGKKLKPNKGNQPVRGVFGLNVGTAMNRTYIAAATERFYEDVYGNDWVPDLRLSYEYRPWATRSGPGMGIYSSIGASFVRAQGKLAYDEDPRFGGSSRTKFQFITLPAQIGPMFRMRLSRIFSPFIGGGPGAIGFIEKRSDEEPGSRGYSFMYWGAAGMNISLDWMSEKTSWEAYESNGIQGTSFTVGYHYMNSFSGGLVDLTVDGLLAGFSFDF